MTMIVILLIVAVLFAGWRIWRRLRFALHMFQLHGYRVGPYFRWVAKRPLDLVVRKSHMLGAALLLLSYPAARFVETDALAALMMGLWAIFFASSRRYRSDQEKKPLAWTNRMKRLTAFAVVLVTTVPIAVVIVSVLTLGQEPLPAARRLLMALLQADVLAVLAPLVAGVFLEPLEAFFRRGFKRKARAKLAGHRNLTVVAVTGSYGKTSVKFILQEILSQRFNVLATPGSFNTPMGICKVINDQLRTEHQVLILEMGMRHPGDIRELCDLAHPNIGIVTNVGVAHLESMGSMDAIEQEKGTLAEEIGANGTVVLNADDQRVLGMRSRTQAHVLTISADGANADLGAANIRYGPFGTSFDVQDINGKVQPFETALLGRHNVANILMAASVGLSMGLRLRQIAHAVRRVQPVPHRLQLRAEGPVTVIDDAFNSNPVGARNAVEILGQFDTGRRVIVTPGMIELGEREDEENRALGVFIAANADLAVLVGRGRTRPIFEGLRSAGFPENKIRVVSTLFEARDVLTGYLGPGDVVLYENDLPDQYDEAA